MIQSQDPRDEIGNFTETEHVDAAVCNSRHRRFDDLICAAFYRQSDPVPVLFIRPIGEAVDRQREVRLLLLGFVHARQVTPPIPDGDRAQHTAITIYLQCHGVLDARIGAFRSADLDKLAFVVEVQRFASVHEEYRVLVFALGLEQL